MAEVKVWAEEPECIVRAETWNGGVILTISTPGLQQPIRVSIAGYRWLRITALSAEHQRTMVSALEQAQDYIRGETPENYTPDEAREDTLQKIRKALGL